MVVDSESSTEHTQSRHCVHFTFDSYDVLAFLYFSMLALVVNAIPVILFQLQSLVGCCGFPRTLSGLTISRTNGGKYNSQKATGIIAWNHPSIIAAPITD